MGIKINNNFELMHTSDNGFIVDDAYVRGGYTTVNTTTERDALPMASRKIGMVVNVVSDNKEYFLDAGIANSNWKEKILTNVSLPGYVPKSAAVLDGIAVYNQNNVTSVHNITAVTTAFNHNTDHDLLTIQMSAEDLKFFGEASIIRGVNSGATAIVLAKSSTNLVIPSKTAKVSQSLYRNGDFIVGEKIVNQAGPALARAENQLMTRKATELLCLKTTGGSVYAPIENKPIYNYSLVGKVTSLVDYVALGLTEVRVSFTDVDKTMIYGGMSVRTPRGVTTKTLHLNSDNTGFLVPIADKVKFVVNDALMVINPVIMAQKPEHLVTKQWVMDHTDRMELTINSSYFTNNGLTTDHLDGKTKVNHSFTIPAAVHDNRWPLVEIYQLITQGNETQYVKVSSDIYRHAVRKSANKTDIIIHVWGVSPSTIKVIIH